MTLEIEREKMGVVNPLCWVAFWKEGKAESLPPASYQNKFQMYSS